MLISVDDVIGANILSLHMTSRIGTARDLIINPNNLEVIALVVDRLRRSDEIVLPVASVREFSKMGLIIDSEDEFVGAGDVVKIAEIIKLDFQLKNLNVRTNSGKKLGYVKDFLLSTSDFAIERLIVHRPVLFSLSDAEFYIARSQIIKVTNRNLIVEDLAEKNTEEEDFIPNFVNPFRQQNAPAQNQNPDAKDIE